MTTFIKTLIYFFAVIAILNVVAVILFYFVRQRYIGNKQSSSEEQYQSRMDLWLEVNPNGTQKEYEEFLKEIKTLSFNLKDNK